MNWQILLAQVVPLQTRTSILLYPVLVTGFGVVVWLYAALRRRHGEIANWRWIVAYIAFAVALIIGWQTMIPMITDPFYRAGLGTRSLRIAHYAAFGLPLFCLLVALVFDSMAIRKAHLLDL